MDPQSDAHSLTGFHGGGKTCRLPVEIVEDCPCWRLPNGGPKVGTPLWREGFLPTEESGSTG